ncbi:MAG: GHKL domain-containing protein [Bacteroidales bacterium]|nr:GHKL domain-containing protein [Bacteroidales bacterium]MCF8345365.1 GHKL domain-containing protein [Bacteroidales bacterium]MCF8350893.1 GHKL domain-containing protein [Bacteroidales bacterium]MCF8376915.1 GHKL domain-containing protein [Bacteroidales bacterium]MCF8400816.1 GHKL domain-containing protein [Bacteroidales bacterium]
MVFRRFRFQIVFRILLIIASLILLNYLYYSLRYNVSTIILTILIILQIILLIRYTERTNIKLSRFFSSIRHADFVTTFSDQGLGKSFDELNTQLNEIIGAFKKYRAEKEEHANYLQTVVQHVSIGIIAYRLDGKVDMINNAAKRLLNVKNLRNITELKHLKEELPELLFRMKAGDKNLVKLFVNDELLQLSIYGTEFRLRGEHYILVSIQNIHTELEEKEIESWQKLIRVLTHEIMNSMTPITSLVTTVQDVLFDEENQTELILRDLDEDSLETIDTAMRTIKNRSQGLLNFVEIYRNLTRIPKPNFRYFEVAEIFERSLELLKPKTEKYGIECQLRIFPEDLKLTADPDLVDQVIINLLLNSIDAVKDFEKPKISILATSNANNRVVIDIKDNGHGIKPDIMDKIFMPFFTSKKEGSGIGLSLSRQIMHLHKGTISVKSKPGGGAMFTLTF